jgi:hypothetical protein
METQGQWVKEADQHLLDDEEDDEDEALLWFSIVGLRHDL